VKIVKKLLIIFLFLFLTGCSNQPAADTTQVPETVTSIVEDTIKIEQLKNEIDKKVEELGKYRNLISGLNSLLKNVYYGYASNDRYIADGFTAFSLNYNDKYYLITAGHCAHYKYGNEDSGLYTYFKFKANFSDEWIYPKLLTYENDFNNYHDYAIFVSNKIDSGLIIDKDNDKPAYILGSENLNINTIKYVVSMAIPGESGSPVIDLDGEVVGIQTGNIVDIDIILNAIDNLK
jgi:hypothetical protein